MAKPKVTLFLSEETLRLLHEYTARHDRFATTSQSADHLLRQALLCDLGEAVEEFLSPSLLAAIDERLTSALQRCLPPVGAQPIGSGDERPPECAQECPEVSGRWHRETREPGEALPGGAHPSDGADP